MDRSQHKKSKNIPKRTKGTGNGATNSNNNTKSRNEQDLDLPYKFNSDDILIKWPLMYKLDTQELIALTKYRAKLEEHTAKLAEPRQIFTHLFNPYVKL